MSATANAFREYLAHSGVDTSGLTIAPCTMERTYGSLVGLFLAGPSAQEAAALFCKWATRERLGNTYEAQHSLGEPRPFSRVVYLANGVVSYHPGHREPDAGLEVTHGLAVSFVYYPSPD